MISPTPRGVNKVNWAIAQFHFFYLPHSKQSSIRTSMLYTLQLLYQSTIQSTYVM